MIGTLVQYRPDATLPMHAHDWQAAIVTDWNPTTLRATLAVFPSGREYFVSRSDVAEGTAPGSFRQLDTQLKEK